MEQVVAAIAWCSTWYLAFEISDEAERLLHQGQDVIGLQVAPHQQVVARETPHRSPIDDAVFPFGVVAQIGGSQMLNGVQGSVVERRFTIGFFHSDVERCDDFAPHQVASRHKDAALQTAVVDCETGYLFHAFKCS